MRRRSALDYELQLLRDWRHAVPSCEAAADGPLGVMKLEVIPATCTTFAMLTQTNRDALSRPVKTAHTRGLKMRVCSDPTPMVSQRLVCHQTIVDRAQPCNLDDRSSALQRVQWVSDRRESPARECCHPRATHRTAGDG